MSALRLCFTDPVLRAAGLVLALQGAVACSFGPYISTLAVNGFGFGDHGYAILMALASLVSVSASVIGGIRADQTARRRKITLLSVTALILGTLLMTVTPNAWTFALTIGLLIPVSSITFGQVFALARLAATRHPPEVRDSILAVIRALFAAPFIVVLPLWSVAFAAGAEVTLIFPVGLLLSTVMLFAVLRLWPPDDATPWDDRPSGLSFRAALTEMGRPRIAARVIALGAVFSASTVYMAIISLIMTPAVGRSTADVAIYVGLVAGLEVPFMLMIPGLTRGIPRTRLIFAGAALYCVHVALLPVLAGSPLVWLLVLPAAIGGAVILTVPIAYLQDLLADRPGAGASLMAVQRLAGDATAATCFALGTTLAGYGTVAILGVAASLFGAAALLVADRR
jgi:MFS transporter, SET family, sugar efflux transporter